MMMMMMFEAANEWIPLPSTLSTWGTWGAAHAGYFQKQPSEHSGRPPKTNWDSQAVENSDGFIEL